MSFIFLRWLGALIALFSCCDCVMAQSQQLYRVDSVHTLQANARYAILFTTIEAGDTTYYALTHQTQKKGLRTQRVTLTNGLLYLTSDSLLWQFIPNYSGTYIGYSANHFLKDNNRSVAFTSQRHAESWHFSWQPSGQLRILTAAKQSELAPTSADPHTATIRYVSTSNTLPSYLYRVLTTTPALPSLPTVSEGQKVGLISNFSQTLLSVYKHTSAQAMRNGTWLPADTTTTYQTTQPDAQGRFALLTQGKALVPTTPTTLTLATPNATTFVWNLVNGRLVYHSSDTTYVLATHFQAPQTLALCPLTAIDATTWQAVSLVELCPPLTAHRLSPTLTQVTGGYTPEAWANLPWQSHQSFDIAAVVLPDTLTTLPQPITAKQALLLADSTQEVLLTPWTNVLLRYSQHYVPLRPIISSAVTPWCYPASILTDTQRTWTLTYPPTTDDGWHTGVTPFDCDVSQQPFRFATLSYEQAQCRFTPTTQLRAGQAFIYQPLNTTAGQSLHLIATTGAWRTTPLPGVLMGSTDTLRLMSETPPTYLLNATGTHFVRAATGSTVLPGRAYLRIPSPSAAALQFAISELVSNIDRQTTSLTPDTYYTPQGTIAGRFATHEAATRALPRGIYIVRGQRLLITP